MAFKMAEPLQNLTVCHIPVCIKMSTFIPVPIPNMQGPEDFMNMVILTSGAESFEHFILLLYIIYIIHYIISIKLILNIA